MGARVPESFLAIVVYTLFCCAGLPLLALVKGVLLLVPVLVCCWVPCTVIAVICVPHDIFYTYFSILKTQRLGRNVKTLALLLLPIPLVLWPVIVCTTSFAGQWIL